MEISSLHDIHYRPSEPAKKLIRKIKEKYPKRSYTSIVDELILK